MSKVSDGESQFSSMVWFMGVVEDVNDPQLINRVRVRCIGFHPKDKTLLPTGNLPWAPFISSTAQMSAPMVNQGDWVVGFFIDGNMAQQPVVIGSLVGIPQEQANPNEGFYDPTGIHPKFPGEGTNSRHSRGEVGTPDRNAIAYTTSTTATGIPTADGSKFAEPESQFNAKYPLNHVIETDGGHVIELDDTPNFERVHIFHKKGSFVEFHPNGTIVHRGVNDRFQIVYNNDNVYVGGNLNLSVVGTVNILAGANTNISTTGDATWRVGGNLKMDIGGNFDVAVAGKTNIDSGDTTILYSGGNVELQGSQVHFNKPTAKPFSAIQDPETIARVNGGASVFEVIAYNDDVEKTAEEYNAIRAEAGLPPADFDTPVEVGESATPEPGGTNKEVKCGAIQTQVNLSPKTKTVLVNEKPTQVLADPNDYKKIKLSKNYTLAELCQGGAGVYVLKPQGGLTVEEIICNLIKVAENVLEPIRAANIPFSINSGWRPAGLFGVSASGKISDHDLGRAVDLRTGDPSTWRGAVKMYATIGKTCKQFLLEYETKKDGTRSKGWCHISYSDGVSKSTVPLATFFNHTSQVRPGVAGKLVDLRPEQLNA